MRRIALVAGLLVSMTLVGGNSPARADFHGLCTGPTGGAAGLTFTNAGGVLTFGGQVRCDGALSASIVSLTLTPIAPSGASTAGPTASCSPCGSQALTSSGSTPATPGTYEVKMRFQASNGPVTANPQRLRRYIFTGSGQPSPYCGYGQLFQSCF